MGTMITCDLCEMDGEEDVKAVAKYTDKHRDEWVICQKHLEDVKKAGLKFEMLKGDEELDE